MRLDALIPSLVAVAVALLDEAVPTDVALEWFELHMTHNVVSHIAASDCACATLTADQNLILPPSVRVGELVLVVLRCYVGLQVLK